jgi:uncharacterized Zn-binding protein involved in type VI secretion
MFAAARMGDPPTHDTLTPAGVVGPPLTGPCPAGLVMIEGMPAAHVGCTVLCSGVIMVGTVHPPLPIPPAPPPLIIVGSISVLIHNFPAARWVPSGDLVACGAFLGMLPLWPARRTLIGGIGSVPPALAQMMVIAWSVNPNRSTINCGFIIDAVVDRLEGSDPNATAPTGQDGSWSDIESRHGMNFNWNSSFQAAYNAVQAGGDGTTALVGIVYSSGTASHIVTLTNQDGQVGIIEGQDWGAGQPPEVITNVGDANNRYNSDGGSNIGWGIIP